MQMYNFYLDNPNDLSVRPEITNRTEPSLQHAILRAHKLLRNFSATTGATRVRIQENGGAFVWQHSNV